MPIIYRSVKGSELTSNEVDGNFEFLDDEKQDNLTFDSTPTAASLNPVTSDGIYQAIQDLEEAAGITDTGVLTYAGASAASANQINIGAATGWIVDNETTPGSPTKTFVNYAGESNKTVTTVGTGLATYVLLDSTGTIVFQNTFPTSAERKTMLYLSKIGHPAGTINIVGNEPDFILSPISQLRDLTKYIGFINLDVHPSANGANLNINTSAGTVYRHNGNFVTDDTIPNEITVASQVAASFLYRTQTGAGGGFVTAIDPTTYDLAGTSTAIPGSTNQATNQRIYLVPGLGYIIQKGQTIYTTLTDAIAAVTTESFVVYPSLINNAILIGVLSVQKGATTLNNTSQARFFITDKFGQVSGATAGVSTATQQTAYDNSAVPQITVTDALGAETFRNGRALDTSNVVEIQNIAGSTTASINGNGVITSTAHIINGTAGAGYLQLLNQSAPPAAVNNNMTLYSDSSNRFSMVRRNIANSADITRTLIFNDATVAYTFPNQNTDTLAGLGSAQTFTAQQTFTSQTIFPSGLVGTPSISLGGVSSGFYSPGANAINIVTGGSIRMLVTNSAITLNHQVGISDGGNIGLGSSSGNKFGTATTQKLSFWNATPIVQPANTDAIDTLLVNTGLRASGGTARFDTAISLLDTTHKTALDVSAANTLRLGSGFTNLTIAATGTISIPSSSATVSGPWLTFRSTTSTNPLDLSTAGGTSANAGVTIDIVGSATNSTTTRASATITGTYAPTTGTTANFRGINIINTINETSTAGNTIALEEINPTLTRVQGILYGSRLRVADTPTGGGTTYNIFADGTAPSYFGAPVQFPSYTVAQANALTTLQGKREGAFIYVNNESGGKTMAFYDGTNWCRVQDRATIS